MLLNSGFLSAIALTLPALLAGAASGRLPLRFEENRGQAAPEVAFLARGHGYTIALSASGNTLALADGRTGKPVTVRCTFPGGNPSPPIAGVGGLAGRSNYILGRDPRAWLTDVPTYARVEYKHVYPGIDLAYYGDQGHLEYDFIVAPGADPGRIRLAFDGIQRIETAPGGGLLLRTRAGVLTWPKPVVYQVAGGVRRQVEGCFEIKGRRAAFRIAGYDGNLPLVIDPVLSYASYFGSTSNEAARAIAIDGAGNAYITGYTVSGNLPGASKGFQRTYGGPAEYKFFTGDAFVAKLNAAGTAVVYSTYLGGSQTEMGMGVAVDSAGNAYVTGFTNSTNFPTTDKAYQRTYQGGGPNAFLPGGDAFVTKLNPAGNALVYSTYLGGELDDRGMAIAVDSAGNAYIAGVTVSKKFPVTEKAFQKTNRGEGGGAPFPPTGQPSPINVSGDGFVAKLDAAGSNLLFSTYLGGSKEDTPTSMALDSSGNIYVAGGTLSSDFPTTSGAYQTTYRGYGTTGMDLIRLGDGFLTKMKPDGSGLVYSTYLGGSRDEAIQGVAVDSSGNAYVTGNTNSANFPVTQNAYQRTYQGGTPGSTNQLIFGDAFVAKLNPEGTALVFSTYLGGTVDDAGWAIAVDPGRNVFVTGHTESRNFPVTTDAVQKTFGGEGGYPVQLLGDAYLAKLSPEGDKLLYSTYFGGSRDEMGMAIALDAAGNGYIAGATYSTDFPATTGVAQRYFGGSGDGDPGFPWGDAFVAKIGGLFELLPRIAITHGASYAQGGVAPGEIVTVFGEKIGPDTLAGLKVNAAGLVDNVLAETRILFDGNPAPLIYVSSRQSSAVVPYAVAGKSITDVQVDYKGARSALVSLPVTTSAPGLFSFDSSGKGPGAILNQDYSVNAPSNAAEPESIVILYGTGEGQTNPAGVDGKPASDVFPTFTLPRSVTIGGKPAEVQYAGAAPFFVAGVFQMNVKLPAGLAPGNHDVVVTIGSAKSQTGLTVAVK